MGVVDPKIVERLKDHVFAVEYVGTLEEEIRDRDHHLHARVRELSEALREAISATRAQCAHENVLLPEWVRRARAVLMEGVVSWPGLHLFQCVVAPPG